MSSACLCNEVFLDGLASQHGAEKLHVAETSRGLITLMELHNYILPLPKGKTRCLRSVITV